MDKKDKILITGASGLIGSALVRLLKAEGYENILTMPHNQWDFALRQRVEEYFLYNEPDYVFHLAAHVGGIKDNNENPATFIYKNTIMHCNIINACHEYEVKKLLFPGSACAYPANSPQPIKESSFLQGSPEPTNLAYAVAKQNGIVMAQSYAKEYGMKVVLPMVANTYGIGDRSSHVIPQMIKKFREAKNGVEFWGTGAPLREFIYAYDVAEAFLFLMQNYDSPEIINVGSGEEISIIDLAYKIDDLIGYDGKVTFDKTKPDGAMRKVLDSSRINKMGWKAKVSLDEGLRRILAS